MKVTKIEIFDCEVKKVDTSMNFNPVMIRLHTDEGVTGLGEVALGYGTAAKAGVGMLRDLAQFILGKDPMNVEAIWEAMYRSSFWGTGGGPMVYGGMSAYDIALWDIRGKVFNSPVYKLLGGQTNTRLRTYASQLHFGWGDKLKPGVQISQYAEAAKIAVAEGYDAIKVNPLLVKPDGSVGYDPAGRKQEY